MKNKILQNYIKCVKIQEESYYVANSKGELKMEDEDKINFEEYGIEFSKKEFANLSKEELKECKKIVEKIKKVLEES